MKEIEINTFYGNEIVVQGYYTKVKSSGNIALPDDPDNFETTNVFEVIENNLCPTDKFNVSFIGDLCCNLCFHGQDKITLNEKDSKAIMNTKKYLSADEIKLLDAILKSRYSRAGTSTEIKNTIESIAKKCVLVGFDNEYFKP